MSNDPLVVVEDIGKRFCRGLKRSLWYGVNDVVSEFVPWRRVNAPTLRTDEFWAVNNVSFTLRRGECLGLIGRNGAGKTTLLKMLNGLIKPDKGRIGIHGQVGALIALGAGFNPVLTGRENIYVNGAVLGLRSDEINRKLEEIIDFADIREFIDAPVQNFSSGMQVRLGFAIATALRPDVLLLDEVLAVGDAAFRQKCYQKINDIRQNAAVVFVSHSMEQVSRICDRVLVLSHGEVAALGDADSSIRAYERLNESGEKIGDAFLSLYPPITGFSVEPKSVAIKSGEPLGLTLEIKAVDQIADFQLRIYFYSGAGHIAGESCFQSSESGVHVHPGRQQWSVFLTSVPLKNGRYYLSINILNKQGALLVWSYKNYEVEITGAFAGCNGDCYMRLLSWRQSEA